MNKIVKIPEYVNEIQKIEELKTIAEAHDVSNIYEFIEYQLKQWENKDRIKAACGAAFLTTCITVLCCYLGSPLLFVIGGPAIVVAARLRYEETSNTTKQFFEAKYKKVYNGNKTDAILG